MINDDDDDDYNTNIMYKNKSNLIKMCEDLFEI
jgi:hypothetical protein